MTVSNKCGTGKREMIGKASQVQTDLILRPYKERHEVIRMVVGD